MQRTKSGTHVQFGINLKVLLPHTMSIPSYVTVLVIMSGILVSGLQSEESAGAAEGGLLTITAEVATAPREPRPRAPDSGTALDKHSNAGPHRTTSETESADSPANVIQSAREHTDSTPEHHSDSTHSSSVIYDNGRGVAPPAETRDRGRTAHDRDSEPPSRLSDLAPAERKQVLSSLEASFLNIVGLSSRPRPSKSVTVPPYMLELYREYMADRESGRRRQARPGLHGSDTIRSFLHHEDEEDRLPAGIAHLKFNITSLPGDERLQSCELRLHREASNLQNQLHINASSAALDELLRSRHRIDVYQVMLPPQPSSGRQPITRLLDTRVVQPSTSGWETFDVTQAVESWRAGSKNYGLEVRFSKVNGDSSPLHHVRLKRSNRDVLRSGGYDQSEHQSGTQRNPDSPGPLLVTYTQSSSGAATSDQRHRREARRKHRDTTRRGKSRPNRQGRKRRRDKPRKDRDYKRNCRRKELYVDFGDVGWTDWIVAPPGYDAFFCNGECPFHLAEHFNTTNHAVVQQFVHSVDPQSVPKACCVPTELSEVTLLYIDEEENVLLRRYEEMVVEACGCR